MEIIMSELKSQIQSLFKEIEFTQLKKVWIESLIANGIDEKDAGLWAVEIGHVVNTYQSNLTRLAELLAETDVDRVPERVHNWVVGTLEDTIPVMTEPLQYLEKQLEKYIPPGEDEED
jgi:hypothetical protein